jgi:hypothetical protein
MALRLVAEILDRYKTAFILAQAIFLGQRHFAGRCPGRRGNWFDN